MKLRLLAFATAADALGGGEHELEVPAGTTVAELRDLLDRRHPGLAPLWDRLAVAVGAELVDGARVLVEGDEVALLPPVSGGQAERVALVDDAIDLGALTAALADPGCGALVVFLGTVRDHHQGRRVSAIHYHAYRAMALQRLCRLVDELEARGDGLRLGIVHRLGEIPVGEASVAIVAASPHRAAAYEASRRALERLKREIPIWKQERYADGAVRWREEEPLAAPAAATDQAST